MRASDAPETPKGLAVSETARAARAGIVRGGPRPRSFCHGPRWRLPRSPMAAAALSLCPSHEASSPQVRTRGANARRLGAALGSRPPLGVLERVPLG